MHRTKWRITCCPMFSRCDNIFFKREKIWILKKSENIDCPI